jgi:hypothetical protein
MVVTFVKIRNFKWRNTEKKLCENAYEEFLP